MMKGLLQSNDYIRRCQREGNFVLGKREKINDCFCFCFGMKIYFWKLKTGSAKNSGFLLALDSLDVVIRF